MKISVVIPTYNSSATIRMTLESVLCQTIPPDEILVLDDGSRDDTVSILNSYKQRVTVFQQENRGVASARNELCALANGDLIAYLDHDDIWHPRYLEVQQQHFKKYPKAVGFFTGHVNFCGHTNYEWNQIQVQSQTEPEILNPPDFLRALDTISGTFVSLSFFCVPKLVLEKFKNKPFEEQLSGVDDCYFYQLLALLGPIVYSSTPLGAYRIIPEAQSMDKVKGCRLSVEMFQHLKEHYRKSAGKDVFRMFEKTFASTRRQYAKRLMGVGKTKEARKQFWLSLNDAKVPESMAKSLALLLLTYAPSQVQPKWPPSHREWKDSTKAQEA